MVFFFFKAGSRSEFGRSAGSENAGRGWALVLGQLFCSTKSNAEESRSRAPISPARDLAGPPRLLAAHSRLTSLSFQSCHLAGAFGRNQGVEATAGGIQSGSCLTGGSGMGCLEGCLGWDAQFDTSCLARLVVVTGPGVRSTGCRDAPAC